MGNPILDLMVARNQAAPVQSPIQAQQVTQPTTNPLMQTINTLKAAKDPMSMLNAMASQNPQLQQVFNLVSQNGGDPRTVFLNLAQQKGVDPNSILSILKR